MIDTRQLRELLRIEEQGLQEMKSQGVPADQAVSRYIQSAAQLNKILLDNALTFIEAYEQINKGSAAPKEAAPSASVEGMREALKPFVKHWQPWMDLTDSNDHGDYNFADSAEMSCFARVTYGDLRRARAALEALPVPSAPQGGE